MTWAKFDDASATHPKARVAGNEAWALWVAAVIYCNKYLTDGFVPTAALATDCLPEPIPVAKAKKLAEKLCEARLRPGGPGLFVRVEGGYQVHDFLHWNDSKADVEARRKRDRDRKRGKKDSDPGSESAPQQSPRGIPDGGRADSADHKARHGMVGSGVGVWDGGPGGNPIRSLDPSEPVELAQDWDPGAAVLDFTPAAGGHTRFLPRFVAHYAGDGSKRTLTQWRQAYRKWAVKDAQDERSHPQLAKPRTRQPDDPALDLSTFELPFDHPDRRKRFEVAE